MDALDLVLPLGVIAVAFVVFRLGLMTVSHVRQVVHQRTHQQLELALMEEKINAAKRRRETSAVAWNGYRKFEIAQKVEEAEGVASFILVPHDRKPLPPFQPGQYLTFRLNIPGREKPVIRCYSLSDHARPDCYRVSIKRVMSPADSPAAPPGLVSNYFHEQLAEGDILDVQAPRGHFILDPDKERPAVLIGGGVGVTPLLSMAKSVADAKSGREMLLFYGVRNGQSHAFKTDLQKVVEDHSNIRLVVCYSQATKEDETGEGRDFHHSGWITVDLLKSYLQSTNYEFFICGPPPMMEAITQALAKWGVAKKDIYTEAFGPATVSKAFSKPKAAVATPAIAPKAAACKVTFAKAGKKCEWADGAENLLDFATGQGVSIESGCRAGNCGTCVVAIKSGSVSYLTEHGVELEEGTCLTCIAAPDGNIVLDA